jgi:hypothetical protein
MVHSSQQVQPYACIQFTDPARGVVTFGGTFAVAWSAGAVPVQTVAKLRVSLWVQPGVSGRERRQAQVEMALFQSAWVFWLRLLSKGSRQQTTPHGSFTLPWLLQLTYRGAEDARYLRWCSEQLAEELGRGALGY